MWLFVSAMSKRPTTVRRNKLMKGDLAIAIAKSKMIVLLDLFDWDHVVLLMKLEPIKGMVSNCVVP